ncbi:hypothetical protein [Streptomyces sp. NPDC001381]|uniref:hypothetical protein n=1 Tax=Streptomyces sp. NPDC001381 TaxID=3364567 RepID=UPI0036904252
MGQAADASLSIYQNGHRVGYIKHDDADPDSFVVCDTYANGHGVTGKVWIWLANQVNDWYLLASADDGGDAGCDGFNLDIKSNQTYMWGIEQNGGGPTKVDYLYE